MREHFVCCLHCFHDPFNLRRHGISIEEYVLAVTLHNQIVFEFVFGPLHVVFRQPYHVGHESFVYNTTLIMQIYYLLNKCDYLLKLFGIDGSRAIHCWTRIFKSSVFESSPFNSSLIMNNCSLVGLSTIESEMLSVT